MEPLYEEVAVALKDKINVARVDVPANRDLGTRFEIQGKQYMLVMIYHLNCVELFPVLYSETFY